MYLKIGLSLVVLIGLVVGLWFLGERGKLLLPSTRELFRAGGRVHSYIYCRWPVQYIKYLAALLIGLRGKQWFADTYHSKVITTTQAKSLISIKQDIPLQDLEQVIPYPTAREIVLTNPLDIVVIECPCRAGKANPCQPSQVCMIIGQPFTDFMLEHHGATSRRITQEEALALLEEVHQRGWVHTAWFKEACLGRFYAICNCCKCCCGSIGAMVKYGIPMISPSGYRAEMQPSKCVQCGICAKVCAFNAITSDYQIIEEKCVGCGACTAKCPKDAIKLVRDERKGIPLAV